MEKTALNENQILHYLGYRDQELTDDILSQIHRNMARVENEAEPRTIFKILSVQDGSIVLPGDTIFCGDFLKDCDEAIVFAATIGAKIEKTISRLEITSMADAIIYDACASAAIEQVCDLFEETQREKYRSEGLFLTDRFSPGYEDFSINNQEKICQCLDTARKIGITVTKNSFMIPRKSVTAVIGISKKEQTLRKRGCEVCSLFRTCQYRKQDKTCQ